MLARFGHFWLFCHEYTHFLVPLLQAYIVWCCPKIDKHEVCWPLGHPDLGNGSSKGYTVVQNVDWIAKRIHRRIDMFLFPLDSQSCGIKLYQNKDHVNDVPDGLVYRGHQQLEQYTVIGLRVYHSYFEVRQILTVLAWIIWGPSWTWDDPWASRPLS